MVNSADHIRIVMCTHNQCFEQSDKNIKLFPMIFSIFKAKIIIYTFHRHVFIMSYCQQPISTVTYDVTTMRKDCGIRQSSLTELDWLSLSLFVFLSYLDVALIQYIEQIMTSQCWVEVP